MSLARELLRPLDLHRSVEGRLGRRGATSMAGLIFQGLLRLAVNVVIGRFAGAAVLGAVAAGQATAQFLVLMWPTTSGQAASRFLARARGRGDAGEIDAVARHLGRTVVLTTVVLAAVSVPISLVRGVSVGGALCVAALLVGVAGQQYTRGVHYGAGAVTRVVVYDIALSLVGLLGVAALLMWGVRDLRLLLPLAGAFALLTVACWPWGSGAPVPRALAREIDRFVAFGSLGTLASAGLMQLAVLVAAGLGPREAGAFSAASTLAIPLTLLSGALSLVLYPSMAEAFGRGDTAAVRAQLDAGVRGLVFTVVPIVAVLALCAPEVVALLYGPGFKDAAPLLAVLLAAVLASMVAVPCVNATTSGDPNGIVFTTGASLGGLFVAGLVWFTAAERVGVLAVATGYLLGVLTTAAAVFVRCWRGWRLPWMGVVARLALAVTAIAVGVVSLAEAGPIARLGAAAVFAAVWVLTQIGQVRTLIRQVRGTR